MKWPYLERIPVKKKKKKTGLVSILHVNLTCPCRIQALAKLATKQKHLMHYYQVSAAKETWSDHGLEEKKGKVANGEIYKSTRRVSHERSKTLPNNAVPCQTIHSIKFL
jgi:hypothetical protein